MLVHGVLYQWKDIEPDTEKQLALISQDLGCTPGMFLVLSLHPAQLV